MLTFKEMKLQVFRRENGDGMIALFADKRMDLKDDDRHNNKVAGLKYLSFFMTYEEFTGLFSGKLGSVNDIGHNVRRNGEMFTFYDLDFSTHTYGNMIVPFVVLDIPFHICSILLKRVDEMLSTCENGGERKDIDLSYEERKQWMDTYGQGKGEITIDISSSSTLEAYTERLMQGSESFYKNVEQLGNIARNTTYKSDDVGVVQLSKDWDGFYFRILTPEGKCTMNGGIVLHGDTWSIHT